MNSSELKTAVCLSLLLISSPVSVQRGYALDSADSQQDAGSSQVASVAGESIPVIPNTGNNATVLIREEIDPTVNKRTMVAGDEIRAYTQTGLLVGLAIWEEKNCVLTVWGDDPLTAETDGLKPGERILFRALDKQQGKEFGSLTSFAADSTYSANSLLILEEFMANTPSAAVEEDSPVAFFMSQNYPNPFNPTTTITYELSEPSSVSLYIFNSLGQLVRTLVQEAKAPGRHSVVWDGTDNEGKKVTSGVYLCQLQAGSNSMIRKLTLVK